jgi:urea carboxylase
VEFNLKEHNQLLRDTKEEVAKIRAEQREAQAKLDKKKEMLEKWAREKEAGKISMDAVEELLNGKHTILFSLDCIADFNEIPASYQSKLLSTPTCGRSRSRRAPRSKRRKS